MNISPATKVYLLAGVTDMRWGYDGLFALARGLLADSARAASIHPSVFNRRWTSNAPSTKLKTN